MVEYIIFPMLRVDFIPTSLREMRAFCRLPTCTALVRAVDSLHYSKTMIRS